MNGICSLVSSMYCSLVNIDECRTGHSWKGIQRDQIVFVSARTLTRMSDEMFPLGGWKVTSEEEVVVNEMDGSTTSTTASPSTSTTTTSRSPQAEERCASERLRRRQLLPVIQSCMRGLVESHPDVGYVWCELFSLPAIVDPALRTPIALTDDLEAQSEPAPTSKKAAMDEQPRPAPLCAQYDRIAHSLPFYIKCCGLAMFRDSNTGEWSIQ